MVKVALAYILQALKSALETANVEELEQWSHELDKCLLYADNLYERDYRLLMVLLSSPHLLECDNSSIVLRTLDATVVEKLLKTNSQQRRVELLSVLWSLFYEARDEACGIYAGELISQIIPPKYVLEKMQKDATKQIKNLALFPTILRTLTRLLPSDSFERVTQVLQLLAQNQCPEVQSEAQYYLALLMRRRN